MSAPKNTVRRHQRLKIYKRDGYRCMYCLVLLHPPSDNATVDHVVALSKGGTNRSSNLVAACLVCNDAKGDQSLDYYLESLDNRMFDAVRIKARIHRQTQIKEPTS